MKTKMTLVLALAFIFLCGFKTKDPQLVEYVDEGVVVHGAATPLYFTPQERADLMGMAINEAGNQGVKGMALVMRVALNRLEYGGYGDNLHSVIFAPSQFATAGMPTHEFGKKCEIAMSWIEHGWDESEGALYFCANGYNGPIPLFRYEGHWFSKK